MYAARTTSEIFNYSAWWVNRSLFTAFANRANILIYTLLSSFYERKVKIVLTGGEGYLFCIPSDTRRVTVHKLSPSGFTVQFLTFHTCLLAALLAIGSPDTPLQIIHTGAVIRTVSGPYPASDQLQEADRHTNTPVYRYDDPT